MAKQPTLKTQKKSKGAQTIKRLIKVRHASGDLVAFQVSATVKRPKGVVLTAELLEQMVIRKAETSLGKYNPQTGTVDGAKEGEDPSGVKLKIIRWKNPDRKRKTGWRNYGSQADRWGSLRLALATAKFDFR